MEDWRARYLESVSGFLSEGAFLWQGSFRPLGSAASLVIGILFADDESNGSEMKKSLPKVDKSTRIARSLSRGKGPRRDYILKLAP